MSGRRRHGLTRKAHHQRSKHTRTSTKHKGPKPTRSSFGHLWNVSPIIRPSIIYDEHFSNKDEYGCLPWEMDIYSGRAISSKAHGLHDAKGARAGGGRSGRRMDHYHMRRRYLHAGIAGAAMGTGLMYGMDGDDMLEEDPFVDDDAMLDDMEMAELMGVDEEVLEAIGSDTEDNVSMGANDIERVEISESAPPLQSEDHCHVFFYHSSNAEDQDQVEHYVSSIENSPHDLKVMTNERDFKADLSHTSNLLLALSLSQRVVIVCSTEFVENDLPQFESVAYTVMSEEDRRNRLIALVTPDVELPPSLLKLPKIFYTMDSDWQERLTKLLSSGVVTKDGDAVMPSAPPLEQVDSRTGSPANKEQLVSQGMSADHQAIVVKEPVNYPNGSVIRRVTACKYQKFEVESNEPPGLWDSYCPPSMLCPKRDIGYRAPAALTRRGLQITDAEFDSILRSLTEASKVTFFQKAVECSLPALFLSTMVVTAIVTIALWFLITGAVHHHSIQDADISASIFWSFMILVFIIPSAVALVMLAVLVHLVNYKYLKYRIKVEELNKKFRETKLVLHCQRAFWPCSARIRLYFIYYNFEPCQQTLYCHVHDNMTRTNGASTPQSNFLGNGDSATLKLDKIMKRVNTLTKKFEWDYFEALTKNRLPGVEEKEHRKKGMCFCQYVLHREMENPPLSVVEAVKDRVTSVKQNAFRKSHRRKSSSSRVYLAPYRNSNGVAHFV